MVVAWQVTGVYSCCSSSHYYYPVYLLVIGCLIKTKLRFCSFYWGFDTHALIQHNKKKLFSSSSCHFLTSDSRVGEYSDGPWTRDVFRAEARTSCLKTQPWKIRKKSALNDNKRSQDKYYSNISVLKMSLKQFHIQLVLESIITLHWVLWRWLFELKRLNVSSS